MKGTYILLIQILCSNKPEQAIELHGNPKEQIEMYEIGKMFQRDLFRAKPDPGQN